MGNSLNKLFSKDCRPQESLTDDMGCTIGRIFSSVDSKQISQPSLQSLQEDMGNSISKMFATNNRPR